MGRGSRWVNPPEAVVFPVSTGEGQARMQGQGTTVADGESPGSDDTGTITPFLEIRQSWL